MMKVTRLGYFVGLVLVLLAIAQATPVQLSGKEKFKAKVVSKNSRSVLVELEIPFKHGLYGLEGDIFHLKFNKASDILAVSPITGSYFSGGSKFSQNSESFICEDIKIGELPDGLKLKSIKFLIKFTFSKSNRGFDVSKDLKSVILTRIRKTKSPTAAPTAAAVPSKAPTSAPTKKTASPTAAAVPSKPPSHKKTHSPTSAAVPSKPPTHKKTQSPTAAAVPSRSPTHKKTESPTAAAVPSKPPSHKKTMSPTAAAVPSKFPSAHYPPTSHSKFPIKAFENCAKNEIALSFEDSDETSDSQISQILDMLYLLQIKSTFFMAPFDSNDADSKCELIPRMIAEGHQIACSSATKNDFLGLDLKEDEFFSQEIDPCVNWIKECSGENYEITQFRPPRGECSKEQAQWISDRGYSIPLWNFDLGDYEPSDFDEKATVLNNFHRMMLDYRKLNDDEEPLSMSIRVPDIGEFLRRDEDEGSEFLNEFHQLYGTEYEFVTGEKCWEKCDRNEEGLCEDRVKHHYSTEYWKLDD
jgi:peptidoglycan/xylan/chitin deacetylase (PgdA/CDA1 family)